MANRFRNSIHCRLLVIVLVVGGGLGCRSSLPPEQPSRLWEVYSRQGGRHSIQSSFPSHSSPTIGNGSGHAPEQVPGRGLPTVPPQPQLLNAAAGNGQIPVNGLPGNRAFEHPFIPPLPNP